MIMKAYTDLQQSKKLAEILPLKSADMRYTPFGDTHPWVWDGDVKLLEKGSVPCWSLAAMLEVLPDEITTDDGIDYNLGFYKDGLQYYISYRDFNFEQEGIETDCYDDFVNACYEMIIKLHEQKLI